MAVILFNGAEAFEPVFNAPSIGVPMINLMKTDRAVSGKKNIFYRLRDFKHVCNTGARTDSHWETLS